MKILFAAAEAVPFAKTGGLGDVIGSLPGSLKRSNVDVRVIMPFYGTIPAEYRDAATELGSITVPLSWRKQYCGLKTIEYAGIIFYFIDNEYYFKRDRLYSYDDDAERFAFFCRAVPESLPFLGFKPDILHCHDWHTGPVSVFLRSLYGGIKFYTGIKTVLTIHNISYQGVFSYEVLGDVLGLEDDCIADRLRFFTGINYLKGGIAYSDLLTTVSKTYAGEIMTPGYGENLDPFLREKQSRLYGIVNGIDYQRYNPQTDPEISCHYRYSLKKKRQNKRWLQQELNLYTSEDVCLLAVVSRLVEQKGMDLLLPILPELLELGAQVVVLGKGDKYYENELMEIAARYPYSLAVRIGFDEALARSIYAGSDLFLMPSRTEPCGLGQLIAMRYASIPVVRETGGLKDTVCPYDATSGHGNGFSFKEYSAQAFLDTVKNALMVYKKKGEWFRIVRNAVNTDYSWSSSAREYIKLYKKLIAIRSRKDRRDSSDEG